MIVDVIRLLFPFFYIFEKMLCVWRWYQFHVVAKVSELLHKLWNFIRRRGAAGTEQHIAFPVARVR